MRDFEEIKQILKTARECGCPNVVIDGVKYELTTPEAVKAAQEVPELKPEDIVKPMSVLDEITEQEMLYWAVPFFDEIQEAKEKRTEQIRSGTAHENP